MSEYRIEPHPLHKGQFKVVFPKGQHITTCEYGASMVCGELNQLQARVKELEAEKLGFLDLIEMTGASYNQFQARVKELQSQVDYYERLEAFIEQFEPRIVDDAREYIIKTQKEASHE